MVTGTHPLGFRWKTTPTAKHALVSHMLILNYALITLGKVISNLHATSFVSHNLCETGHIVLVITMIIKMYCMDKEYQCHLRVCGKCKSKASHRANWSRNKCGTQQSVLTSSLRTLTITKFSELQDYYIPAHSIADVSAMLNKFCW
jgi:ribosomal protein L40E